MKKNFKWSLDLTYSLIVIAVIVGVIYLLLPSTVYSILSLETLGTPASFCTGSFNYNSPLLVSLNGFCTASRTILVLIIVILLIIAVFSALKSRSSR